jgi:uncharacterized protein YbjQ (UPF0145 family)
MLLSTGLIDLADKEVLGVVIGSSIQGSNLIRDLAARIADTLGGAAGGYKKTYTATINAAVEEMQRAAENKGAVAVEGMRIVASPVPMERGGLFTVLVYGTAIKGKRV